MMIVSKCKSIERLASKVEILEYKWRKVPKMSKQCNSQYSKTETGRERDRERDRTKEEVNRKKNTLLGKMYGEMYRSNNDYGRKNRSNNEKN